MQVFNEIKNEREKEKEEDKFEKSFTIGATMQTINVTQIGMPPKKPEPVAEGIAYC